MKSSIKQITSLLDINNRYLTNFYYNFNIGIIKLIILKHSYLFITAIQYLQNEKTYYIYINIYDHKSYFNVNIFYDLT